MEEIDDSWITLWGARRSGADAMVRLWLLQSDLRSLEFAYSDFEAARRSVEREAFAPTDQSAGVPSRRVSRDQYDRMFHQAKVFVCAMKRFARLLESARARRHEYPRNVADAINLAWRTHKADLETYDAARNAIEHINGEVGGANRRFLNLWRDHFEVVANKRAYITREALVGLQQAWRNILRQLERADDALSPLSAGRSFIDLIKARCGQLQQPHGLPHPNAPDGRNT